MKHLFRPLFLAAIFLSFSVSLHADSPWHLGRAGYKTALMEQSISKEKILIYFYTTWCPYCRKFEKKVLFTPEVEAALTGVHRVKVDVDQDRELAQEFGVTSFPRLFVLDVQAGAATQISTGMPVKEFLKEARRLGLKIR